MSTTIIPLLKDKMGDISDVNNYRPIAIATATSKLIENIILHNYGDCLATSDNQFSYKKEHSTDMAVFCLKETVNIYRRYSSPLFVCFLDASKAFDKLNHWALFAKLIERNMTGVETNARPLARGEWKSLGMSTNLSAVVPRRVHNMRFFTPVYPLITYYPYPIYALT